MWWSFSRYLIPLSRLINVMRFCDAAESSRQDTPFQARGERWVVVLELNWVKKYGVEILNFFAYLIKSCLTLGKINMDYEFRISHHRRQRRKAEKKLFPARFAFHIFSNERILHEFWKFIVHQLAESHIFTRKCEVEQNERKKVRWGIFIYFLFSPLAQLLPNPRA